MSFKKPKVFLAAYTNQTNAQNLSCRALAKYLDKAKFEVLTLEIHNGNLPSQKLSGVHTFKCQKPVRLTGVIGLIWGFYSADVVYLPRGYFIGWQRFLTGLFSAKTFKTVRNVIDDEARFNALSELTNKYHDDLVKGFSFVNKVYSMTSFMATYNEERWGIRSEKKLLLPPTDFEPFFASKRIREKLENIVFVGNSWRRKGINDFIMLSQEFSNIKFHIVGHGDKSFFEKLCGNNVIFHGMLIEDKLVSQLTEADLLILPSRSEGLPRVWIEALSNGLPSILYSGYGAEGFVKNEVTGYVVDSFEEMKSIVKKLESSRDTLKKLSTSSIQEAVNFHPKYLTEQYELVIQNLLSSNPDKGNVDI